MSSASASSSVSIITVTYNSAKTLGDTIQSILAQTHQPIEHVIVDGGSTDGTINLIREVEPLYGGRLKWISEPDGGIYDAMNKGVRLASGDIVGILNSDDLLASPTAIADVVELFAESGCDATYADLVFIDQKDTSRITRTWHAGKGSYLWGWIPPHPTLYVARAIYEQVGAYRTDCKISADYDFMLRAFHLGSAKLSYLDKVLVKMRRGGESTNGLASNRLAFAEAQRSLTELGVRNPTLVNVMRVVRKVGQFPKR